MTGTPPQKMRWRLDTKNEPNGIKVMVKFPSALARAATVDGEEVAYNRWVKSTEVAG